jgi:hypothetical protein
MWIEPGAREKGLRDFRVATLAAAVAEATTMAAAFFRGDPAVDTAELTVLIFGHRQPVFNKGPQLIVTGEPGQLTAKDVRHESAVAGATVQGATLEDLLAAAGADPAQSRDYAISWTRPAPAILGTREGQNDRQ